MARILFVDDDPDTLRLMKTAVVLFGHNALLANSGQEAICIAEEERPDLILMDMRMYDMDGITAIRHILSNPSHVDIPIVMVSASASSDLADQARAAGAKDYLQKPIQLQTLQNIIQNYTTG
jgi:CheY-like chemotaxis protein